MASESSPPASFSARRRWAIFFSVLISIVAVFGLVIMLNYLGARYYARFMWSSQTGAQLSPQTVSLLKHITNQVKVIVYYDKADKLYSSVAALLDEYRLTNPKISVRTVDYLMDAAKALELRDAYKLGSAEAKNLVIFDCNGRRKIILASQLADYTYEAMPNEKEVEYARHLKAFEGEKWFSAALLSVISPKPMTACFLKGHGEHNLDGAGDDGYLKFGQVLEENNILTTVIKLTGSNVIPADCNLLIIAGCRTAIPHEELEKIRQYLKQGGRLFVLFNSYRMRNYAGLEAILAEWNVNVGLDVVEDPENHSGNAMVVSHFNRSHPLVAPLIGSTLVMVRPRSVAVLSMNKQGPEAPKVDELAYTGKNATVGESQIPQGGPVPIMAAVEKGSSKGVPLERGTTAILVAGDSFFLDNQIIEVADNRDFAGFAVAWLLDQTQLLQGVGPRAVKEYKLMMTNSQMTRVRWLFLGAMPGAILLLGGLVWLRRRH